jgi:aspartate/methionine/tyrosine aminotransferase
MAVRARDPIIARQQVRIQKNIRVLDDFMHRYSGCFRWNRPSGSSVCFPRMLMSENTFAFCEKLIRENGIMLVPSRTFHYGDHHVRFGFGRDDFADNIERFSDYLSLIL